MPVTYQRIVELHEKLAAVLVEIRRIGSLAEAQVALEVRLRALEVQVATMAAASNQKDQSWAFIFMAAMTVTTVGLNLLNFFMR